MSHDQYFVYIMSNPSNTVLYTGVTNNLLRRVEEHKNGSNKDSFTKKYNVIKLVFYEAGEDAYGAISREKQLKAGSRKKKIDLINSMNPDWKDLSNEL